RVFLRVRRNEGYFGSHLRFDVLSFLSKQLVLARHNVRTKALPVFVPCLRHPGNEGLKCRDGGASLSRHAGYGDNQREETHTRDLSPHVYITPQSVSSNSSIPFVSLDRHCSKISNRSTCFCAFAVA